MAKHLSIESKDKIVGIVIITFLLMLLRLVGRDFFYDEIYFLAHYIFVPLSNTVLQYQDLNNHFLLGFICNIYMKIIGCDLFWLMEHPYVIRLPLMIIPGFTIYYLYRFVKENISKQIAIISVLLFVTTVPYYYYAIQVRGYNLSIMLIVMTAYYAFRYSYWAMLTSALFCYVMPSNFVFLFALIVAYGILRWEIAWNLILGGTVAVILYIPMLHGILNDPQIGSINRNPGVVWEVFTAFMSYRFLLLPFAIYGLMSIHWQKLTFYIIMIILPFVLFFIKGTYIYGRVMLPILPFFCIFMAIGLVNFTIQYKTN